MIEDNQRCFHQMLSANRNSERWNISQAAGRRMKLNAAATPNDNGSGGCPYSRTCRYASTIEVMGLARMNQPSVPPTASTGYTTALANIQNVSTTSKRYLTSR